MKATLLTAEQLAEKLGVAAKTVRAWACAGKIPAVRFSRKSVRFDLDEVLAAVKKPRRQK
jgi:excisionase family DNA binding protein